MYTVTIDSIICAALLAADEFSAAFASTANNKTIAFPMADMGIHLYLGQVPSTPLRRHNVYPSNNNSRPNSIPRDYCLQRSSESFEQKLAQEEGSGNATKSYKANSRGYQVTNS